MIFFGRGEGDQGEGKSDAPRCSITPKFIPIVREEQGVLPSIALVVRKERGKKKPNPTYTQT